MNEPIQKILLTTVQLCVMPIEWDDITKEPWMFTISWKLHGNFPFEREPGKTALAQETVWQKNQIWVMAATQEKAERILKVFRNKLNIGVIKHALGTNPETGVGWIAERTPGIYRVETRIRECHGQVDLRKKGSRVQSITMDMAEDGAEFARRLERVLIRTGQ